ncbi:hypothetical protein [Mesorhizobium sp. M0185]|uniref:hypothetical protein n=1 Tax=Mesorhizobium sp. M0185 TaxID=2956907 RepID=UPI00333A8853
MGDLGKSAIEFERQNRKERQSRQIPQAPENPSLEAANEPSVREATGRPQKKPNRPPSDQRSCQRNCYKTNVIVIYGAKQEVAGPNHIKPQPRSKASCYRFEVKEAGKEIPIELAMAIWSRDVSVIALHLWIDLRCI